MLFGFIDRTTSAAHLKEALDASAARVHGIQSRVAQASIGGDGFALPTAAAAPGEAGAPVDVEQEMASLADEQLRYEATAKLLEKAYQSLRTAIRDR